MSYTSDFTKHIDRLRLRNFQAHEFLAKGGSHHTRGSRGFALNTDPPRELWPNIDATATTLQSLRDAVGAPLIISSVYRSPAYNRAIGGSSQSLHMRFNAIDFSSPRMTPRKLRDALLKLRNAGAFRGGIGLYRTFVHVDTRGQNVNWTGTGVAW